MKYDKAKDPRHVEYDRDGMMYAAILAWFYQWAHQEPPTRVEYSLTVFLLKAARELAENNGLKYHNDPACYGHVHLYNYPGFCKENQHLKNN